MRKKIETLIILSFVILHSFCVTATLPTNSHTISPYGFDKEWPD